MKKQTKTIWVAVATIAGLAVVLVFAFVHQNKQTTSTAPQNTATVAKKDDNYVLRLGDPGGVCGAPQQIAQVKGFFKKVGLKYKVVKVDANTTGIEAVTSNKIDASNSLLGSIVQPIANGAQLKITTGLHTGCISVLTAKGSTLKAPKDFVGKKIGLPLLPDLKRRLPNVGWGIMGLRLEPTMPRSSLFNMMLLNYQLR